MQRFTHDAYVIDVLMPDLVGHDHRPAAFLVYLYLSKQAALARRDTVAVSLATIAVHTGLSKSTVQSAIRHLLSRRLLDPGVVATTAKPRRRVMRPWLRGER
jgi:hypothetical protein